MKDKISKFGRKIKVSGKKAKTVYKKMTFHSRVVLLLKIALPSITALFVGTIILLPKIDEKISNIEIDIPTLDTKNNISFTMDNGEFYGQGDNGSIFSINIKNFSENRKNMIMLFDTIEAKIFLKDASWIEVETQKGNYKSNKREFIMTGNTSVTDSDNNQLNTTEAIMNIKDMSVYGNEDVKATTPFGNIEGEGFNFKKNDKYIFKGKIKALIDTSKIEK